jgi:hypothetical protein
MITELPMSNQWQVTFRTTAEPDQQYAQTQRDLPQAERALRNAAHASERSKRAVA